MIHNGFFYLPKEHRYHYHGGFSGIAGFRRLRAHKPGITDDQLDDLWELGEEIASDCTGFFKSDESDPIESCVKCVNLPTCTGEREEVRPNLIRMIKIAFRHDLGH